MVFIGSYFVRLVLDNIFHIIFCVGDREPAPKKSKPSSKPAKPSKKAKEESEESASEVGEVSDAKQ